jgi:hypothetical protein
MPAVLPLAVAAVAAAGGVSVTPAIFEQTARTSASGTVTVANTTNRKLKVTVTPRPWRQARSGTVAADRRRTLSRYVRVTGSSFTLAAGTQRSVTLTLRRVPARRSLYGSLEVVGKPTRKRKGINVVHRLVSSLRFHPTASARKLKLRAGDARVTGKGSNKALLLRVRNAGNTIDPVGGSVVISGSRGGRSGGISSKPILPGKSIDLRVASLSGLPKGSYSASITLSQAGRNRLSVTRRFRIR